MIEFKARTFVLPAIALTVLAMLHAPADGGRLPECGPAVRVADPGIRASFAAFERRQSLAGVKACAFHSNSSAR